MLLQCKLGNATAEAGLEGRLLAVCMQTQRTSASALTTRIQMDTPSSSQTKLVGPARDEALACRAAQGSGTNVMRRSTVLLATLHATMALHESCVPARATHAAELLITHMPRRSPASKPSVCLRIIASRVSALRGTRRVSLRSAADQARTRCPHQARDLRAEQRSIVSGLWNLALRI